MNRFAKLKELAKRHQDSAQPKYAEGQTVYFGDDPEPGIVQEVEQIGHPDDFGYIYRVKFAGTVDPDWPGFRYTEGCLFLEPTNPFASQYA